MSHQRRIFRATKMSRTGFRACMSFSHSNRHSSRSPRMVRSDGVISPVLLEFPNVASKAEGQNSINLLLLLMVVESRQIYINC